jgi:phosphoglycerate dehydrogenase-like enzyme
VKVLIHDPKPDRIRRVVEAHHEGLEYVACDSYAGLAETVCCTAPDVAFSNKFAGVPYPREPLVGTASVRWVHVAGTGIDHLRPWDPNRITVTNCAGFQSETMAQYAMGAVFALNFRFPEYLRDQAARRWAPKPVTCAAGHTLLVVGMGPIGRRVAERAAAAGYRIIGYRRSGEPLTGVAEMFGPGRLHEALAQADAVVVVVPLTDDTRGLIGRDALAALKPGAILVNMARGGIVDEDALADALRSGRLRGAVLDVFAREPLPPESPLWGLDNVILTPHVSSVFEGWELEAARRFSDNLARWRAGEPLHNVVDPVAGY